MSAFKSSKVTPEKLQKWLENETSADVVFTRLHLHELDRRVFDKPQQFATWISYADALSAKLPEMSAISILTRKFGDYDLFRMIEAAKTSSDMNIKTLATELEAKQMQFWLTTKKDPDDIFRVYNLQSLRWKNIFKEPEFTHWAKYVDDLNAKYPEEPTWMYSTLTKHYKDEVLLKKIYELRWTEDAEVIPKLEDDWLQAGIQNHKTPYQVLLDLGLGKKADNILVLVASKDLFASIWVKYMQAFNKRYPDEKTTMVETFTKAFGDIGVTKMLYAGKEKDFGENAENLVTKLESAQLNMWLNSGKSTDDVFNLLKLDKATSMYNFQDKQLLNTWVSYLNIFIKENPDKTEVLFAALQSRLKDIHLNEILNLAKNFPSIKNIAIKIQKAKIESYHASNESPSSVFQLLGLENEGIHILSTSQFKLWMKYVEDFNKRNLKQESWYSILSDEYSVERMIEQAMLSPSTVKIGEMLETEYIKYQVGQKTPPERTFFLLGLKKADDKTLITPAFKLWTRYLNEFNKRYPEEKVTMIEGLRANYYDISLLYMFKTARNDPTTETLVTNLENALINKWLVEETTETYLREQLGRVDTSEGMIQRYIKKRTATTGKSS
ncbi:Avirulence (Avh) protein [Phytophthora megakarya]|uniref:Avirulence (Avh) protein n=1 Tax=Phytophthora megakarya TaxID=4795 RepID=A0A225VXA8_9STRA|nr:Avirulence (Avh) protein [Phytophthora megakarya]